MCRFLRVTIALSWKSPLRVPKEGRSSHPGSQGIPVAPADHILTRLPAIPR